jgi:hypothetical protein
MWLRPGARPRRFTAEQQYVVARVAFVWRARFTIAGFAPLRVVDRLGSGQGSLEARLFGSIPLTRESGDQVTEGQVLRYLAELPWVPHALTANPEIELIVVGPRAVEAATRIGPRRAAVRLELNETEIVAASATRPRLEDNGKPTSWTGTFGDYRELGGLRIPTKAEARWELPDGPFTYWQGEITHAEQIP